MVVVISMEKSPHFVWLVTLLIAALSTVDSFRFEQQRTLPRWRTTTTQRHTEALRSSREDNPIGESAWSDDEYEYDPKKPPSDLELRVFKKILVEDAKKTLDDFIDKGGFDLETYVDRHVESIAPASDSSDRDNAEANAKDAKVGEMEGEILEAIKDENFEKAQNLDKNISAMHLDDCGAVLQVNSRFYRAFTDKSLIDMKKVWLLSPTTVCIHPSNPPIVGYDDIVKSWAKLFESSDGDFQKNWIECDKIRLVVRGSMAMVLCEEKVWGRRYVRGVKKRQNELINQLTATNVFRKVGGSWFLVNHHASWHHKSELSAQLLKDKGLGRQKKDKDDKTDLKTGILRDFGPISGSSSGASKKNEQQQQPQIKRVIMGGSLNDLLGGGLDGMIESMRKNKEGANNRDEQRTGVWHIKSTDAVGDGANEDDDDIEEEEDEDDEEDDDTGDDDGMGYMSIKVESDQSGKPSSPLSLVKEWTMGDPEIKSTDGAIDVPNKSISPVIEIPKKPTKETLKQSCISALRKLSEQGSLSQKQKRALLTDIITCSARGETSMVEVAYELLLSEVAEDSDARDVAEEEFSDQCRVFADDLFEQ